MTDQQVRQKAILEQADTYINRKNLTSKDIDKVKSDTSISKELKEKVIELLLAKAEEVAESFFDWLISLLPWNKSKKRKK